MDLISTKVIHQDYGEGTIVTQEKSYITVKFKHYEVLFLYLKSFFKFRLSIINRKLT